MAGRTKGERAQPSVPVFLLFGLPESGIEAAARAIHGGGAALARDAETMAGRFAVSAALDRLATEINAEFGIADEPIGPLAFANTSLADSRGRIAADLKQRRKAAADAVAAALPADRTDPVVIVAGAMSAFPAFWLDALRRAGVEPRPVLVHRNPLAIAQLAWAERGKGPRPTIYQWHHLALEVLSTDRNAVSVLVGPEFDLAALGIEPGAGPTSPALPRTPGDDTDLADAPIVSDQSRDLHRLLVDWRTLDDKERRNAIGKLRRRFDDAVTLTGASRIAAVTAEPPAPAPTVLRSPRTGPRQPPLLFHYHIFKNAGTSVDRMLKANFAEHWAEREFVETSPAQRHAAIRTFLEARPELRALSSHTAPLPEPELADRDVFPILFVRHPLLRVRSAYHFERRQDATTRGAVLAKTTDFAGYVTALLDDPKARQLRNFQTIRFAAGTPGPAAQELKRAIETMDRLPFVGLVEAYDQSVARLGECIRPAFPEFEPMAVHANATGTPAEGSLDDRLAALRDELGADLYDRLLGENRSDLALFDRVRASYGV